LTSSKLFQILDYKATQLRQTHIKFELLSFLFQESNNLSTL